MAVVLMIGLSALFSAVTASQYHTFDAADRASFNPVSISLAARCSPWSRSGCWAC